MKKLLILFVVGLSLLGLAGCTTIDNGLNTAECILRPQTC